MSEYIFTKETSKIATRYLRELCKLSKDFDLESQAFRDYAEELEGCEDHWLKILFSASSPQAGFFNSIWLDTHSNDIASESGVLRFNLTDDLIVAFEIAETARLQIRLAEEQADYIQQRWISVHEQCATHASMGRNSVIITEFHDASVDCHDMQRRFCECVKGYRNQALQLMQSIWIVAYGGKQKLPLAEELIVDGCNLGDLIPAANLRLLIEPLYREAPEGTFSHQIQCLHEAMEAALTPIRCDLRAAETRYREVLLILRRNCPDDLTLKL